MLKIYNSLTREKKDFEPLRKNKVSIYVCGPTVYDEPHIGHARSAYVFDVIRRYFEYRKYKVTFVRNVTDVDDKIINKAREEFNEEDLKAAVLKISRKYLAVYHKYMKALGIRPPDYEPKATKYIAKMQKFIKALIKKGAAYEADGDVYFNVTKAKNYGKLSNQSLEMLESSARPGAGENKKDPLDFALWKKAKEAEPCWKSPWGKGRPGWHIECSVMSSDILGDEFDIHGGGMDLIFPHHENEKAQSQGAGKKFARYWVHNGLVTINKEKMAKSLGNFVTVEELLSKYSADTLKILFLQTHYSQPVDFSWERMEEKRKALGTILNFLSMVKRAEKGEKFPFRIQDINKKLSSPEKLIKEIKRYKDNFKEEMDDDFNTPCALAFLFKIVNLCDGIWSYETYKKNKHLPILIKAKNCIQELGGVLGLSFEVSALSMPEEEIKRIIEIREGFRKGKMFEKADQLRKELEKKGIILEDTKEGTVWRKKL